MSCPYVRRSGFSVRNQDLQVAVGELPPIAIWPEIWVWDDERFREAQEILADLPSQEGKT